MDVDVNWTEKLISIIESKPCLYNKSMKDYSNKDLKMKAWTEVCESVICDWQDLSDEAKKLKDREVQQRWTNLRNCFLRELREQKRGVSGQAANKRRKYIYFDQMLFLLPTLGDRETTCNVGSLNETQGNCSGAEADDNTSNHNDIIECSGQESRPLISSGRSKKRSVPYQQALLDILKEKSEKKEESVDEDKSFLMSLLPAFKRMTPDQKFEAKMDIMRTMHTIEHRQQTTNQPARFCSPYIQASATSSFLDQSSHFERYHPESYSTNTRASTPSASSSYSESFYSYSDGPHSSQI